MDLNEMLVLTKVVEAGSFIGAARQLAMPKSTVSRKIKELEERLGARLIQRNTRQLRLTEAGNVYHQHAARAVIEAEEAEQAVSQLQEAPQGRLRVTIPLSFGYLAPVVSSFLRKHSQVQLELVSTDRVIDLIEDGFDIAIRVGKLADSSLMARKLGTISTVPVASSAFVNANGLPQAPADLADFDCIVFGPNEHRRKWNLEGMASSVCVDVRARMVVNDYDFLEEATVSGMGISLLPAFRTAQTHDSNSLIRVLPDWQAPPLPLHGVYPSARHLPPKVTAFLEHVSGALRGSP